MTAHLPQFFGQILTRPSEVGAIFPSGAALAREMTAGLDAAIGPIIELGPGSGAITRALLTRGIPASHIHAVEMNTNFCALLATTFPGLVVHAGSAADLERLPLPRVGVIVSGLPLLSIPAHVVEAILISARARLLPGGRMVQFTYGTKPPVCAATLARVGFACRRGATVWRNVPPARVYTFERLD